MAVRAMLAALCVSALSAPALAHHTYSMFDRDKTVVITGAVKSFDMINPHSWLLISALDPQGQTIVWSLEMGPPRTLIRDGWTAGAVQPGDMVTLKLHPMRDGSHAGQLINATLPSGKRLGGGGPEAD